MVHMGTLNRVAEWLGLRSAAPATDDPPTRTVFPSRTSQQLSIRSAVAVPSAYRAIQIITTAISQLPMRVERGGVVLPTTPTLIQKPCLAMSRSDWLEACAMSLLVAGNAYLHLIRDTRGTVLDIRILNPHRVSVGHDPRTGAIRFQHGDATYTSDDILHLHVMRVPGALTGMGPIEAARRGLTFTSAAADYAAGWFDTTGQPAGVLSTDKPLTTADALRARNQWNHLTDDGEPIDQTTNPSRIKVIGQGLSYEPLMLKPADALWLEAQDFTTLEIARLFGVPSSLMLVGVDGKSNTYTNVEQEWIGFVRFTLMQYVRKIEEAMTTVVVRGESVRIDLDVLLRTDTGSRYQAYSAAITAGWLSVDEVRDLEGLPPINPTQEIAA